MRSGKKDSLIKELSLKREKILNLDGAINEISALEEECEKSPEFKNAFFEFLETRKQKLFQLRYEYKTQFMTLYSQFKSKHSL